MITVKTIRETGAFWSCSRSHTALPVFARHACDARRPHHSDGGALARHRSAHAPARLRLARGGRTDAPEG